MFEGGGEALRAGNVVSAIEQDSLPRCSGDQLQAPRPLAAAKTGADRLIVHSDLRRESAHRDNRHRRVQSLVLAEQR